MRVGSLFAGIGGFDLGLERAGMSVAWQSEIDPYASAVLKKHWPDVPNLGDIREIRNPPTVDVLCGGFPCQDISVAGKGAGIEGERSGLWREYARIIGEVRPRYVVVENVAALLGRGLGRVLGDLSEIGYDAEWHCISAAHVGAPHIRERIWIVAYPDPMRELQPQGGEQDQRGRIGDRREDVADPHNSRRIKQWRPFAIREEFVAAERGGWWRAEPDVGRVADGIPARVDRIRCLGNAIVPQIAEIIGRAIVAAELTPTNTGESR